MKKLIWVLNLCLLKPEAALRIKYKMAHANCMPTGTADHSSVFESVPPSTKQSRLTNSREKIDKKLSIDANGSGHSIPKVHDIEPTIW
jgi:hypothetical protein